MESFLGWGSVIIGSPAAAIAGRLALRFARQKRAEAQAFVREIRHGLAGVTSTHTQICLVSARVEQLEIHLGKNGGKSVRDAIDRIEALANRSIAMQAAFTNVFDRPVFFTDRDGNFTTVNRHFEDLTGYSCDDLSGRGWHGAIHESDRARVVDGFRMAVKDRRIYRANVLIQRRQGDQRVTHWIADPIRHERTNEILGWLGIVTSDRAPKTPLDDAE